MTTNDNQALTRQDTSENMAHMGSDAGRGILTPVETPLPNLAVPDRLRAAYNEAPALPDRELIEWAQKALRLRADRANDAAHAAYRKRFSSNGILDIGDTIRRPIIDAGVQAEDFDHAQHLQRLDVAERKVAAAERAAEAEAKRQAAKCRVCGALDVATRRPIVVLTVDAPVVAMQRPQPGETVVLDGGVVCAPCEATVADQYRAALAADPLGKRRNRADAARDYLARLPR